VTLWPLVAVRVVDKMVVAVVVEVVLSTAPV
jgi:hypothetical protein